MYQLLNEFLLENHWNQNLGLMASFVSTSWWIAVTEGSKVDLLNTWSVLISISSWVPNRRSLESDYWALGQFCINFLNKFLLQKAVKAISWTSGQFCNKSLMNSCSKIIGIDLLSSWSVLYHFLNEFLLENHWNPIVVLLVRFISISYEVLLENHWNPIVDRLVSFINVLMNSCHKK